MNVESNTNESQTPLKLLSRSSIQKGARIDISLHPTIRRWSGLGSYLAVKTISMDEEKVFVKLLRVEITLVASLQDKQK